MVSTPLLPKNGRAYVAAVIVAGFLVISWSVHQLTQHPVGIQWFLLAALTLISGSATVKLLNRTGFIGGLIPREDGAHGTTE